MLNVKAIIVFNGGSAGDFLKAVCNTQFNTDYKYYLTQQGMIDFDHHHFKMVSEKLYKGQSVEFDPGRIQPIENSHYYLDIYPNFSEHLFFIDYPEWAHEAVIHACMKKRFNNNIDKIMDLVVQYVPEPLRRNINQTNWFDAYQVMMKKNLRLWHSNSKLRPIDMSKLFDHTSLIEIVETVCQQPVINPDQVGNLLTIWKTNNQALVSLFDK